jgi:phosphoglycerate dehydrogenase-like enzyme
VKILVMIHSPFAMWIIPDAHVRRLRDEFPHHEFLHAQDDDEGVALIPECEAAFSSQITRDHFAAAPKLRWVHSPAAGVGGMLFPDMVNSRVVITNSRGMSADTIAEHVLAVTLAMFRRLPLAVIRQAERTWAQDEIGGGPANRRLAGARVLIIGLGAIGRATARLMSAVGTTVTGVRRQAAGESIEGVHRVATRADLDALLPEADVVVLATPQTKQTRGLIGEQQLARMRQDAILVNVSRGKVVDEEALIDALRAGTIGGAALDVFEHEPLDPASPLWAMPQVLITPHTSGFRPDHWDAATALFAANLRRFDRGESLANVVDKTAGY